MKLSELLKELATNHPSYIQHPDGKREQVVVMSAELIKEIEELERLAQVGAAVEAQGNALAYAIIGGSLVVRHPAIMPHEITHADGKWYIYPISPELEKLKGVKFRHDNWRPELMQHKGGIGS